MSPLTKLFVVFHVILSLLLTAGLIVFVNRTENFKSTAASSASTLAIQTARAQAAEDDARIARDTADKAVAQANAQIADVQKQLSDATAAIADRDTRLAAAASAGLSAAADSARLTDALKASEDQKTKLNDIVAQLRTDSDSLVKKNSDLNLAVSDLTNKLDVTGRERANFSEQLAEAKSQNDNLSKLLHDLNGNPADVGGLRANGGAVPINGVVRDVNTINQIPYATISVGAADNVQKGMEFNIIDREKGLFLGKLTVDSVEPNSATGKLDGPHVGDVHKGVEVRTQL